MKRKLLRQALLTCRMDTLFNFLSMRERKEAVLYCYNILSVRFVGEVWAGL